MNLREDRCLANPGVVCRMYWTAPWDKVSVRRSRKGKAYMLSRARSILAGPVTSVANSAIRLIASDEGSKPELVFWPSGGYEYTSVCPQSSPPEIISTWAMVMR